MPRHLAAGTVAVCTGKPPRESDGLTLTWDAVTCKRCRSRLHKTMQKMSKRQTLKPTKG